MRESWFRAKTKRGNKWVEGSLVLNRLYGVCNIYPIDGCGKCCYETIPETVGQYTGMKDKNHNMIYEGDIVKIGDHIDLVVFSDGCFCMDKQFFYYEFTYQYFESIEVIGNIHDNPELLQE